MHRDIIVVGASAGGVECLTELCRGLPADFPAAVLVVLHVSPHANSVLPAILSRAGALNAHHATDDEPIEPGHIYIAPPDHHLLIQENRVRVVRGPRENGHRPAVDPLFRTAARFYGERVIGVVLSGALDDGTAGLIAVKSRGGLSVVQDPLNAFHPSMPTHAIDNADIDWVVPMHQIAAKLIELVAAPLSPAPATLPPVASPGILPVVSSAPPAVTPPAMKAPAVEAPAASPVSPAMEMETDMSSLELSALHQDERPGSSSGFSCPECHGVLFEIHEGDFVRFRCRVGHAYSPNSLLADQAQSLEAALWIALRALEESAALATRVARRAEARSQPIPTRQFRERAAEADRNAAILREVLLQSQNLLRDTQPPSIDIDSGPDVNADR